jgi:import inner membrane translocase subunit TIM16
MTMEEACLILNVKKEEPLDVIEKVGPFDRYSLRSRMPPFADCASFAFGNPPIQHYETIFAANAPKPPPSGTKKSPAGGSHYLQSKVFRALERIKAEKELEAAAAAEEGGAAATEGGSAAAAEAPTASEETVFTAGGGGPAPQEKGPLPPPPENEPIMTGPPPPSSSTKSS